MKTKFIDYIKNISIGDWTIEYRVHATKRMFERDINEIDIVNLIENGFVIEEYIKDRPFQSALVNGTKVDGTPLHMVVAIDFSSQRLYIITTYSPDSNKWIENFSRRKK